MPYVNKPLNGGSQRKIDKKFTWLMQGVFHVSSIVIVGSSPGGQQYYQGSNPPIPAGADPRTDLNVNHPGNNQGCYTRPVYYKVAGGAQCTDGSTITGFTSTP
jgi:hypothetical protein